MALISPLLKQLASDVRPSEKPGILRRIDTGGPHGHGNVDITEGNYFICGLFVDCGLCRGSMVLWRGVRGKNGEDIRTALPGVASSRRPSRPYYRLLSVDGVVLVTTPEPAFFHRRRTNAKGLRGFRGDPSGGGFCCGPPADGTRLLAGWSTSSTSTSTRRTDRPNRVACMTTTPLKLRPPTWKPQLDGDWVDSSSGEEAEHSYEIDQNLPLLSLLTEDLVSTELCVCTEETEPRLCAEESVAPCVAGGPPRVQKD